MGRGDYKRMDPWSIGPHRTLLAKTCRKCNTLKQGHEYKRNKGGYIRQYCADCDHIDSRKYNKIANDKSRDKAKKAYEPWMEHDYVYLWELINRGLTHKQIAEKMDRSITAISIAVSRSRDREYLE